MLRLRFLSDQPVPGSCAARRGIELRLGARKLLDALPNPSMRRAARLGAKKQDTFQEVVKVLKVS